MTCPSGDLSHRIVPPPEQELRTLAITFNEMGEELQGNRARLEKWNEELDTQVKQRTQELKEAQARLAEAKHRLDLVKKKGGVDEARLSKEAALHSMEQRAIERRNQGGKGKKKDDETTADIIVRLKKERDSQMKKLEAAEVDPKSEEYTLLMNRYEVMIRQAIGAL